MSVLREGGEVHGEETVRSKGLKGEVQVHLPRRDASKGTSFRVSAAIWGGSWANLKVEI